MKQTVIHFGHSLTHMIFDHDIGIDRWTSLLDHVQKSSFRPSIINKSYKIYQIHNLTYEFEITPPGHYICYSDDISGVNPCQFQNALTYDRCRTILEYDFQSINSYYNIHETTKNVFVNISRNSEIVFEQKDQRHEIMIIRHENTDHDPSLIQLIEYIQKCLIK